MNGVSFYEVLLIVCALGVVLAVCACVWMSTGRFISRCKAERFRDRHSMTPLEFYAKYYKDSGFTENSVVELLTEIAESIEVPVGLLRPTDRFLVELADPKNMGSFGDGGLAEMTFAAERRIKLSGCHVDFGKILTVDDYIRGFARATTSFRA